MYRNAYRDFPDCLKKFNLKGLSIVNLMNVPDCELLYYKH